MYYAVYSTGWGFQDGTAPPKTLSFRSPVPAAALWLVDKKAMTLPDAAKALGDWRSRLAKLTPVTEGDAIPRALRRMFNQPELTGKPAPGFTVKDVDGRQVTLASMRGKVVLLDFWATWCAPCRMSLPHVQALHNQFKEKGLVVAGVDTNEPAEKARKYFADRKFTFANLLGSGSGIVKDYGAEGIPLAVLIDREGVVRYVHRGWGDFVDFTPEVKKLIER